jgi:zinc transport system substrate-binding protein
MNRLKIIICICMFGWIFSAQSAPLKVVVSVLPQRYFVERIGADTVEVEVLVPPGASPHSYQPLARQMVFLARADVYFRIGMPFENGLLPKIKDHFNGKLVDLREGIPMRRMEAHHHEEDEHEGHEGELEEDSRDPHFWLDPKLAIMLSKRIAEEMTLLRPENRELYASCLHELIADLDALDVALTETLAGSHGKYLLVFHPAWGYFAERYGMHQVAVEREGKAPSAKHIGELIRGLDENVIPLLLVQPQFEKRVAQTIAHELGIVVVDADPLALDYIGNLRKLIAVISGTQPE